MELDVVFKNKEHIKLRGRITYPDSTPPHHGIILCHGFAAHKNSFFFPKLVKTLVQQGYATLAFDCRANGDSEGTIHPTYKTMTEDLLTAIDYFSKQEKIKDIILLGHSMGGSAAILAATERKDIAAIITVGAVAHPDASAEKKKIEMKKHEDTYTLRVGDRIHTFNEAFFEDAQECDVIGAAHNLHKPLFIIHGTADKRVNVFQAKELFLKATLPKSIKLIEEGTHRFSKKTDTLIEGITNYLQRIYSSDSAGEPAER